MQSKDIITVIVIIPGSGRAGLVGSGQRQTQSHLCWVGKVVLSFRLLVSLTDKYKHVKIN